MYKMFIIVSLFIISCDSENPKNDKELFNQEIVGRWKTDRNDNCIIITEFFDNDSLVNTRNQRVIKGTFEFFDKGAGRTLKSQYSFDDGNLAGSCDEDATIFEGQTFIFPAILSEDGLVLELYIERTDTVALAVLRKQL